MESVEEVKSAKVQYYEWNEEMSEKAKELIKLAEIEKKG